MTSHPHVWLLWLLAALVPALLTRNPFYLILTVASVALVLITLPDYGSPLAKGWLGLVKFSVIVTMLAVPLNALVVHSGRIILISLPAGWPVIGGAITGEAVMYGLATGLNLATMLLIFATFNVAVDQSVLLRLVPPFLLEAGVVAAIAVTFVPYILRNAQEIREAQLVRGHRFRGIRDLGPLFMTLLTTSLERSIGLAESMESRGFGGSSTLPSLAAQLGTQIGIFGGLTLLAVGLFLNAYRPQWRLMAVGLGVAGLIGVLASLWVRGRRIQRSRYRPTLWRRRDTRLIMASLGVLTIWGACYLYAPASLIYYPYPPAAVWPPFNLGLGAVLLLLSAPAWLAPTPQRGNAVHPAPPMDPRPLQGAMDRETKAP